MNVILPRECHPSTPWIHRLLIFELMSRLLTEVLPNGNNVVTPLNFFKSVCWMLMVVFLVLRLICEQPWSWWFLKYVPEVAELTEDAFLWCAHLLVEVRSGRWWWDVYQQLPSFTLRFSVFAICSRKIYGRYVLSLLRFRMWANTPRRRNESLVAAPESQAMDRCDNPLDDENESGLEMTISVHDKHA